MKTPKAKAKIETQVERNLNPRLSRTAQLGALLNEFIFVLEHGNKTERLAVTSALEAAYYVCSDRKKKGGAR